MELEINQVIVISAPKGAITNRLEAEKAVRLIGATPIFIEYRQNCIPPTTVNYCILTTPVIKAARKGK